MMQDANARRVHGVRGTSGNVHEVTDCNSFLHQQEELGFGDARYQDKANQPDPNPKVKRHIVMRPSKGRALDKNNDANSSVDR